MVIDAHAPPIYHYGKATYPYGKLAYTGNSATYHHGPSVGLTVRNWREIERNSMSAKKLTNAELSVMELLWESERLTARQILEQLYDNSKKSQHGTVQRLMQSLVQKGFAERDRSLGVNLFSAAITREAYGGLQLESLAQQLTGGSIAPLLTHLLEEKKLGKVEIRRLRKLLKEEPGNG